MKRVVPRRLVIFGGLAGLILGLLIVVGFLAAAHLQKHGGEGEADAILEAERQVAESSAEPAGEAPASSSKEAPAQEPPFPYTTWGLVGRIAAAQLEAGDEDGSRRTMALIPAKEGGGTRIYRTHLDRAYNNMLNAVLQGTLELSRPARTTPYRPGYGSSGPRPSPRSSARGCHGRGPGCGSPSGSGGGRRLQEAEGKDARYFLAKSVAEVGKVKD